MSTSISEKLDVTIQSAVVEEHAIIAYLSDGRTLSVPIAWYPRLLHATQVERNNHKIVGQGGGIHWPELDEDISLLGMLNGRPSGESAQSLKSWLDARASP